MSAVLAKISKAGGAQPDEFEVQVATEIHHLEVLFILYCIEYRVLNIE